MTRFMMAITAGVLWGCGSAFAQIGSTSILPGLSPLGMTSPLGIGPGSPVAPTNLPLGATELASPGVSPMTSGASPTGIITTCSGVGGSMPGTSSGAGASTFDGGGMSGNCRAPSDPNRVGRLWLDGQFFGGTCGVGLVGQRNGFRYLLAGLNSTGLYRAGRRPPICRSDHQSVVIPYDVNPLVVVPNQSASFSTSGSTTTCQTTGTGVPSVAGVTTPLERLDRQRLEFSGDAVVLAAR
jgi:hypothetical protein